MAAAISRQGARQRLCGAGQSSAGNRHCQLDGPKLQIYAWEIPSGDLRPMTRQDDRNSYGWLGPTGDFLYFLQDERETRSATLSAFPSRNEIGHIVRVPFTGGPPYDVTFDLPLYTLRGFDISRNGNRLAFDAAWSWLCRESLLVLLCDVGRRRNQFAAQAAFSGGR